MKTSMQKKGFRSFFSLLIVFALTLTSCHKEKVGDRILKVIGKGEGTFGKDLDSDKDIDGSYFEMNVSIFGDHSANGYFDCLMSDKWDFLGLPLMEVQGSVTRGSVDAYGRATFSGVGMVNLGKDNIYRDVPFTVKVLEGGPQVGSLTLSVIGLFDGVPGDTKAGNNNYDLPDETVDSGQINFDR